MKQTAIIFSGVKITFSQKNAPLTSGLKNLITGKFPEKAEESTQVPAKKIALTHGEPSPHCSCKIRFETPIGYETEKGRHARRMCKHNDGRKQKGKKPPHVKITQMIF